MDPKERDKVIQAISDRWGQGTYVDLLAPSLAGDERLLLVGALERLGASPGARPLLRLYSWPIDVVCGRVCRRG